MVDLKMYTVDQAKREYRFMAKRALLRASRLSDPYASFWIEKAIRYAKWAEDGDLTKKAITIKENSQIAYDRMLPNSYRILP
jgi:hypothetical protein